MVFHRFLAGEPGLSRIEIVVNNLPLKPFDPFHGSHPATQRGQTENVQIGDNVVEITPFTLPHHRNVTPSEWDRYAGEGGYFRNQGFYLYREKRLILHGTWFGLARQTELTKLARVRIDMPNAMDADWLIDVKKSWARPPLPVRERLQRILEQLGAPSRGVFTIRGRRLHDNKIAMWERVQQDNRIVYRINMENPVIQAFANGLPSEAALRFQQVVHAASAGLPMDALYADLAGTPQAVQAERLTDDAFRDLIVNTVESLRAGGVDFNTTVEMMRVAEPFRSSWDRTEELLEEIRA
jgi:hypothetical protein